MRRFQYFKILFCRSLLTSNTQICYPRRKFKAKTIVFGFLCLIFSPRISKWMFFGFFCLIFSPRISNRTFDKSKLLQNTILDFLKWELNLRRLFATTARREKLKPFYVKIIFFQINFFFKIKGFFIIHEV